MNKQDDWKAITERYRKPNSNLYNSYCCMGRFAKYVPIYGRANGNMKLLFYQQHQQHKDIY